MDADGQHKAEYVEKFVQALIENHQLVLGVRPKTQRVSERLFQRIASILWDGVIRYVVWGYSIKLYRARRFLIDTISWNKVGFFGLSNGYKSKQIEISVANRMDTPALPQRWCKLENFTFTSSSFVSKNSLLQSSNKDDLK